jgi:uncharacterized protein YbjQ (UPF0145 family)
MCEEARQEAFALKTRHAAELGANAMIGMRCDAKKIGEGVAEVLASGAAVGIEPAG